MGSEVRSLRQGVELGLRVSSNRSQTSSSLDISMICALKLERRDPRNSAKATIHSSFPQRLEFACLDALFFAAVATSWILEARS